MTASPSDVGPASAPPWWARVLTLYPEVFPGPLGAALAGRGLDSGLWRLETVDIRRFARDKHGTVDDHPFGGGAGMVMRPDVLAAAIDSVGPAEGGAPRFLLSPRGAPLTQEQVKALAGGPGITLICGRFEGVDERVLEGRGVTELSVGDYVLSGGEVAAMTVNRRLRAPAARRGRPALVAGRGEFRGRPAGISAIHATPPLRRPRRAGGSALRRSRRHRRLAPSAGGTCNQNTACRPVGTPPGAPMCGRARGRVDEWRASGRDAPKTARIVP